MQYNYHPQIRMSLFNAYSSPYPLNRVKHHGRYDKKHTQEDRSNGYQRHGDTKKARQIEVPQKIHTETDPN